MVFVDPKTEEWIFFDLETEEYNFVDPEKELEWQFLLIWKQILSEGFVDSKTGDRWQYAVVMEVWKYSKTEEYSFDPRQRSEVLVNQETEEHSFS